MKEISSKIRDESNIIVKLFNDNGIKLDYSINSFIDIDLFIESEIINATKEIQLDYYELMFSISCYIGETLVKCIPNSIWSDNTDNPYFGSRYYIKFVDGSVCSPSDLTIRRIRNGLRDGIYKYGYSLKENYSTKELEKHSYIHISEKVKSPWWKFFM